MLLISFKVDVVCQEGVDGWMDWMDWMIAVWFVDWGMLCYDPIS